MGLGGYPVWCFWVRERAYGLLIFVDLCSCFVFFPRHITNDLVLDIAHGSSHHPDFSSKKTKKITGLPCSRLASPKTVFRRLFFCFLASSFLSPSIFVYHDFDNWVGGFSFTGGGGLHAQNWLGGGMDLWNLLLPSHSLFFFTLSRSRTLVGFTSGFLRMASAMRRLPLGDPRLSAQTLGSRDTYSFLHRIGMERSGGRAWDIHLFSTFESTITHLKKWLSRIRF